MPIDIFTKIQNFFKKFEITDFVDFSLGNQKVEFIIDKALLIAKEKKWLNQDNENDVKLVPHLIKYQDSKKLIWCVYFLHTQENWRNQKEETPWLRFAIVKISDENGEILSADLVRPMMM